MREDGGRFVDFTDDFARVWNWKDELPEQRLVCTGKHLGGRASLVSLRVLPALYSLTGRSGKPDDFREEELSPVEEEIAAAVLGGGPVSTAELPELVGHERKRVASAQERLQRRLILTAAGRQERERGWPAVVLDVLPRRYRLSRLGDPAPARVVLAELILATAGEVSAADVTAVIGGSRKDAAAGLDALVEQGKANRRNAGDFDLWTAA